jgi:hypothetical protein
MRNCGLLYCVAIESVLKQVEVGLADILRSANIDSPLG